MRSLSIFWLHRIMKRVILDEPLVDEENGIICSTSNELLMDALNDAIAQFKESDAYEELKTKWGM